MCATAINTAGDSAPLDAEALERQLVLQTEPLRRYIERHLPIQLRNLIDPDDVLQETYIQAFRRYRRFEPRGDDALYRWLATIARNQMRNMLEAHVALKRGRGKERSFESWTGGRSLAPLLEQMGVDSHTPSKSAMLREALSAVRVAIASLSDDVRRAVEMRFILNVPVPEIAVALGISSLAVYRLCTTGLSQMREVMGRASQFRLSGS